MDEIQEKAAKIALTGHNLLLLGQSGTGKTFVVSEICKSLQNEGKSVSLTGTTGMAALNIGGITVHSWSGIWDGRFSNTDLVRNIFENEHLKKYKSNITNTDCLIIDEISMLSAKLFDQLEYICRKVRANDFYFGGIQVIASGDFFQLPPVPDNLKDDPGYFCFKSSSFPYVFKHKIILEKVIRQDELDLVIAISDVAKGDLQEDSVNLLKRLQRPLPPGTKPVRLFARNFDKDIFNCCSLMDLEGKMHIYDAVDEGDSKQLEKIAVSKKLHLKLQCPVMLVKNLSQTLVNGLQGVVVAMEKDIVTVKFAMITAELKKQNFTVFSSVENKVIASRQQIPLVLAYGVTIHKAQGQTLHRVEVDCSNISRFSQLGVAIGRATKKKGLRLLNFDSEIVKKCIKPEQAIFDLYKQDSFPLCDNCDCCKIPHSFMEEFQIDDVQRTDDDNESESSDTCMSEFSCGELEEINRLSMLQEDVSGTMYSESADVLQCPITVNDIMSCIPEHLVTKEQVMISVHLNNLIVNQTNCMNIYLKKLFEKICNLFLNHCDVNEKTTDSKMWTKYHTELYKYSNSKEYISLLQECLRKQPDENDFTVFSKVFDFVSRYVLEKKSKEIIKGKMITDQSNESVTTDDAAGQGKIRYIAGRCVAKSKFHYMKICKNNLYNKSKRKQVSECFLKVRLLDTFTANYKDLSEDSQYKDTLEEIRRKQNLNQGLTNVNDSVFEFFKEVNKCRLLVENEQMLHLKGSSILKFVHNHIASNTGLLDMFKSLLQKVNLNVEDEETSYETCLKELFEDLISRFSHVADNQFRKDMIRSFGLMKAETLRKRVVTTKLKKESTATKLTMANILSDESENKTSSHLKLKSHIYDKGISTFDNFTNKQLFLLCKAYNVKVTRSSVKKNLTEKLISVIPTFDAIPEVKHLSKDNIAQSLPDEQQPSTSDLSRVVSVSGDPQPSTSDLSKVVSVSGDPQPSTSGISASEAAELVEKPTKSTKVKKRKSTSTFKRKKKVTKTKSSKKDDTKCKKCNQEYNIIEDWIQCDLCDNWYHRVCQNIDDETFANLGEEDWYCYDCCK